MFTIGRWVVFSLARWSSRIPTGFLVSRGTWDLIPRSRIRFRLRGYYPLWPDFPEPSANGTVCNSSTLARESPNRSHDTGRATLARLAHNRFRLIPFRSPLLRESLLLSLPGGTEMVHFPPFASTELCIHSGMTRHDPCRVSSFGDPRIKACLRLPVAYRSLPRPSSPLRPKASTMRP